jgi:pyruvate/2-oxoglutarate dehydrogenase complex dihydrolipoamide acyltransferase (E2) component
MTHYLRDLSSKMDSQTLSLSFDHRLTDGAPAARFLQIIAELIEDPML